MAAQSQNMDQFEAYFRRADLDQDGRISGAEAVAFLNDSNLPQPVLAQVISFLHFHLFLISVNGKKYNPQAEVYVIAFNSLKFELFYIAMQSMKFTWLQPTFPSL